MEAATLVTARFHLIDLPQHPDIGEVARLGEDVFLRLLHQGHPLLQVELLHLVGIAHVQVDRPGVDVEESAGLVHRAQQGAGAMLDDAVSPVGSGTQVDTGRQVLPGGEVAAAGPAHQAGREHLLHHLLHLRPKVGGVMRGEGQFAGGAEQVGSEDARVGQVDDGLLHRLCKDGGGVAHQVLVERGRPWPPQQQRR